MGPKKTPAAKSSTTTAKSTAATAAVKGSTSTTTAKSTFPEKSTSTTSTAKASTTKTSTKKPAAKSTTTTSKQTTKKPGCTSTSTSKSSGTAVAKKTSKPKVTTKTAENVKPTETEVVETKEPSPEVVMCPFPQLSDVLIKDVNDNIKNSPRWVLLIDTSGLAVTFLRYRDTNYLNVANSDDMATERLRMALLGAIWYGKQLVLDMMDMDFMELIKTKFDSIQPNLYQEVMSKDILKNERYRSLVRPDDEDQYQSIDIHVEMRVEKFMLIISTKRDEPPDEWKRDYYTIKVIPP